MWGDAVASAFIGVLIVTAAIFIGIGVFIGWLIWG